MQQGNALQDIADIFSMLHDGGIDEWSFTEQELMLKVGCTYLAELISKDFNSFYLKLTGVEKFEFEPWRKNSTEAKVILTNIDEIFNNDLEIKAVNIKNDFAQITCDSFAGDTIQGGTLMLSATAINLFDENRNPISIDTLALLCNQYWKRFSQRK